MSVPIIYPSISIVIATFNSSQTIDACLKSIVYQEYPKNKIEIIIVDGGSSDKTLEILNNYKVKIIHVPIKEQEAEYNKGVGVSKARNELLMLIDHDNVLPHKNWIKKMVYPLIKDKDIVGVEVLRFAYRKSDLFLDRYFALLGGVDPVPYYLGKDARLSWAEDTYTLLGDNVIDKGLYYAVTFKGKNIPTLGANGFVLRRKLLKFAKADPDIFFHIDINYDLILQGYNTYAFVKDEIYHFKRTRIEDFVKFLIRRKKIMERQYFDSLKRRRYAVYNPDRDKLKLVKYIFYTVTFIKPCYDAIRGYRKIHDPAWFVHPFVCWGFLLAYGLAVINLAVRRKMGN